MYRALLAVVIAVAATFTGTSAQADVVPPCWTSFNPTAPGGGPMVQYYRNCNPFNVWVDTGFRTGTGQINYNDGCRPAAMNNWIFWNHHTTRPGSDYQTVLCVSNFAFSAIEPGDAGTPCWTTFLPAAPNGGRMTQTYRNCNGSEIYVGPVYTNSSGQIVVAENMCERLQPGQAWKWDYSATVPGVNYSTAICNLVQ